jgi:outer membrane receptor protein involved in Fe transport
MKTYYTHTFILLILTFILGIQLAKAQSNSITGIVMDSLQKPLPTATVMLLNKVDSSLINFAISNPSGKFEIKAVKPNEYIFKITFIGYESYTKIIQYQGVNLELGNITLKEANKLLDGVIVEAEKTPVMFNKDTIVFDATTFKTNPNAVVEDLLKKLPGVEVDKDGTITAQGEEVRRVTVDGKTFFGNDPKIATKNLPADAIDKVQVYDKKSDMTQFTGIDDGQREKTINLQLKEDKKRSTFGKILGAGGTNERYQGRLNLNRFNKGQQLSILGNSNNINDSGFSVEDYISFLGGMRTTQGGMVRIEINSDNSAGIPLNLGGQTSGIMKSNSGGINLNQTLGKKQKTEFNGSYFANQFSHDVNRTTERVNNLPSGIYDYNQHTIQQSDNFNHRFNSTLDHQIDSMNSLKFTTNLTYNIADLQNQGTSKTILKENNFLQNDGSSNSSSSSDALNLNTSMLFRHKFAKKGRTFSSNLELGINQTDRDGNLESVNNFYGQNNQSINLRQENSQSNDYQSYSGTFSYTEPLGGRKYLEANYQIRQNDNQVNREVYDISETNRTFNEQLSNKFNSSYTFHRTGLNFRLNRKNYNFMTGLSYQRTDLDGELKLNNTNISKRFENFLPRLTFNYEFSNMRRLSVEYETSVQEPTIQQLQPIIDNSDPLNIYQGNPNLKTAYNHEFRLNYTYFDPIRMFNIFTFVESNYTQNAFVNAQTVNDKLVRTTQPVNVDNQYNLTGNISIGFPLKKLNSRFSIGSRSSYQRNLNLLNSQISDMIQTQIGGNVRYEYTLKDFFDFSLAARLSNQENEYGFSDAQNQRFLNEQYSAESNLTILKKYRISANAEYYIFRNMNTNSKQEIPLINLSISRYVMKHQQGEIKLSVQNLLDRDAWVSQDASVNFYQKQTTNLLGRYVMLSFQYSLNKFLDPANAAGRGMRVMFRD